MDKDISEEFKSLIGILTGDSASPDLCTVFLADLKPPSDEADIIFGGTAIDLQKKFNYMWCYGSVNFLLVNNIKTLAMIFGPIPKNVCSFHSDGIPINLLMNIHMLGSHLFLTFTIYLQNNTKTKLSKPEQLQMQYFPLNPSLGLFLLYKERDYTMVELTLILLLLVKYL